LRCSASDFFLMAKMLVSLGERGDAFACSLATWPGTFSSQLSRCYLSDPENETEQPDQQRGPRGLGVRTHGLASEYSQEQGWGTNTSDRTKGDTNSANGGTDYDYGARDFGEVPSNQADVQPSQETKEFLKGPRSKQGSDMSKHAKSDHPSKDTQRSMQESDQS
jgi:hypothetical protein